MALSVSLCPRMTNHPRIGVPGGPTSPGLWASTPAGWPPFWSLAPPLSFGCFPASCRGGSPLSSWRSAVCATVLCTLSPNTGCLGLFQVRVSEIKPHERSYLLVAEALVSLECAPRSQTAVCPGWSELPASPLGIVPGAPPAASLFTVAAAVQSSSPRALCCQPCSFWPFCRDW